LAAFLLDAGEGARRRGDRRLGADHLALALARPHAAAAPLLAKLGVGPLDWRDQITTVLGWAEGAKAEREGRPAGGMADSLADLRFSGALEEEAAVSHGHLQSHTGVSTPGGRMRLLCPVRTAGLVCDQRRTV
jgi:hypothetical protein